jgi:hypothetical protein
MRLDRARRQTASRSPLPRRARHDCRPVAVHSTLCIYIEFVRPHVIALRSEGQ